MTTNGPLNEALRDFVAALERASKQDVTGALNDCRDYCADQGNPSALRRRHKDMGRMLKNEIRRY